MARSVQIETGSQFTQLYFFPVSTKNPTFVGYVDIVHKSIDGAPTLHTKVYKGTSRDGSPEYYVNTNLSVWVPQLDHDGVSLKDDDGKIIYKEISVGRVDKSLRYKVKRWLTSGLTAFYAGELPEPTMTMPEETESPENTEVEEARPGRMF